MNKIKTDISVIVPSKDSSDTLQDLFESFLHQTALPCEIIIVDNGSTDNSYEIANNFAKKNAELKIVVLKEDTPGRSQARNKGIKASIGSILAFTDTDCHPADDWLENIHFFFAKKNDLDAVGGYIRGYKPNTIAQKLKDAERASTYMNRHGAVDSLSEIVNNKFMDTANMAIRKKSLSSFLFDEKFVRGEDIDFSCQLFLNKIQFETNYKKIKVYHSDRTTMTEYLLMIFYYRFSYTQLIKKYFPKKLIIILPYITSIDLPFPFTAFIGKQFFLFLGVTFAAFLFPYILFIAFSAYIIFVTFDIWRKKEFNITFFDAFLISFVRIIQKVLSEMGKICGSIKNKVICL